MSRRLLPAALLACAGLALLVPAAPATPTSGATAIVSLGDSFISGEAGRWRGNSTVSADRPRGDRPRAGRAPATTPSRIYGGTDANGCHRSDVAEILSADVRGRRASQPGLLGRARR